MDRVGQGLDAHGTHVRGIIPAVTDHGFGMAGTAPDAKILPIKSLEDGSGSFEDIVNDVRHAVEKGAVVVVAASNESLPCAQARRSTMARSA